MNLKQKTDSDCKFYDFSLLVPYPNNLLVVCVYILIFHGIYSPPANIFFVGLKIFFVSCSQGLGKFQISLGPSVLGGTNILFWEVGRTFSSTKLSMTNHVKLRIVYGKIICFMCVCELFSLLVENFSFENFLSVQVSIQTLKKCLLLFGNNFIQV